MWRNGVSIISPEGSRWNAVPMPAGCEVKNISCGATGLVWAVLWSGKALVRTGVSLKTPMGNNIYRFSLFILLIKIAEIK